MHSKNVYIYIYLAFSLATAWISYTAKKDYIQNCHEDKLARR